MRPPAFAFAAAAIFTVAAPAAAEPYTIDKSHAAVTFTVGHLGFSTTHGFFRSFDATIDFDPDAMETSSVEFVIDSASIDTMWDARNGHLKSADFLDVAAHPTITFKSTSVALTSAETATITGDLTIIGVTHEESFAVRLNKIGPSPFNPALMIAGFNATGAIDRTKYGMGYGAPAIGAIIDLRIDLEMSPTN
jgi:polyisoprenoid-binding protein YceI